ncbi:MAG TPA: cysteine hydrolase family protein [Blastocatellia bacterium]|nr:cysteine hydrolase family protein [Blastocatellia bacterium]
MNSGTALLVIDVQVGIIDGLHAFKGAEVVETINGLLSKARGAGAPVLYVQHDGDSGHVLETNSPGWKIHPAIAPAEGEPVVRKRASDSFFETSLARELDTRGIGHLVVTGCATQYCIDTICRRAVSLGYDVTLVSDAHTTVDDDNLSASQIIKHHNSLLDGFDAGEHAVSVKPAESVRF